jgi:porin
MFRLAGSSTRFRSACALPFVLLAICLGVSAWAGEGPPSGIPDPSIATSLPGNGDPFGARAALAGIGVTFGAIYIGEGLGTVSGGIKRGAEADGLLELDFDTDLEKFLGWKGAAFHASGYQFHSTDAFTAKHLGSLITSSNIESFDSTLLYELWLEQKFLDDKLAIRFGQLAADTEFLISDTAGLFIGNTFGWAILPSLNLPTGGPIYPLATPGVRVKVTPNANLAALVALYNGNPVDPNFDTPQGREKHGLGFRIGDPPLLMGEVQWKYNRDKNAAGLPGTLKIGGWHHFGKFDHQRYGADGLSLADPVSNGVAARLRGNSGIYGVVDQQLYQRPGADAGKGISAFARVMAAPGDRNSLSFYGDAGLVFSGFVAGRPGDAFGVAVAYSKISDAAAGFDWDALAIGTGTQVRDFELDLELNYLAEIAPGWTVQPMFQYIWNPGGTTVNPDDPKAQAIRDAAVFGLRTTINY